MLPFYSCWVANYNIDARSIREFHAEAQLEEFTANMTWLSSKTVESFKHIQYCNRKSSPGLKNKKEVKPEAGNDLKSKYK